MIGTDIVDNLFPGVDPLGKEIRIDGWIYHVIGVGKKEGKTLGQSRDNYVHDPDHHYLKQFGAHNTASAFRARPSGRPALDAAIDETRAMLRARRHDPPG